jgi:hypothetical protein
MRLTVGESRFASELRCPLTADEQAVDEEGATDRKGTDRTLRISIGKAYSSIALVHEPGRFLSPATLISSWACFQAEQALAIIWNEMLKIRPPDARGESLARALNGPGARSLTGWLTDLKARNSAGTGFRLLEWLAVQLDPGGRGVAQHDGKRGLSVESSICAGGHRFVGETLASMVAYRYPSIGRHMNRDVVGPLPDRWAAP